MTYMNPETLFTDKKKKAEGLMYFYASERKTPSSW